MSNSDPEKAMESGETAATTVSKSPEPDGELNVPDKKYEVADQTNYLPTKQVVGVFVGLSIALLCSFMEQTIVATALPRITSELQGGKGSQWVATAYLLTSLAFTPFYGRWSDIFGRKAVLLFSLATFWIFSLACALAQSMIQLIVFRALQGIGGGALITLVLIIVADVTTLRERGKYQAINEIVIAFANGIGPILGGVFSTYTTWCFWINLPLGGLAIATSILLIPFKPIPGGIRDKLVKIDYTGSGLTILSSVLLILGLSWGGVTYGWDSVPVIVSLVLGIVILGGFIIWEWRGAKLPIVPVHIFANPTVLGVYIATLMNGMAFFSVLFYMPQLLQLVRSTTPLKASVFMLPFLFVIPIFVFIHGQIVTKTGKYRLSILSGYALWAVSQGLLSTVDQHSGNGEIIGFLLMGAVGAGGTFQTALVAAQAAVPRSEMAVVTGIRNFLRLWGSSIALAVCAALVNNTLRTGLNGLGFDELQISEILNDPTVINHAASNFTAEQRQMIIDSYTVGFRRIFYMTSACIAVAFFASLFLIKQHELERADDKEIKSDVKERLRIKKEEKRARKADGAPSLNPGDPSRALP